MAVHAKRLAPIAGGQIDSPVSRGCVISRLVNVWLGLWDQPVGSRGGDCCQGYSFTLVVNDFGVKYINKTNVNYLTSVLSQDYEIDTGLKIMEGTSLHAGIH